MRKTSAPQCRKQCFHVGVADSTHLAVARSLYIFGLLLLVQVLAALTKQASFQLSPPGFPSAGLCTDHGRGRGQRGRAQQALPGAQIVLLHRAVLVALMTGTVHFVITGVEREEHCKSKHVSSENVSSDTLILKRGWGLKLKYYKKGEKSFIFLNCDFNLLTLQTCFLLVLAELESE